MEINLYALFFIVIEFTLDAKITFFGEKSYLCVLIETDLNIDEIRERCGFSNSTAFYNYFKQQYGVTPRQYRQNCLAK